MLHFEDVANKMTEGFVVLPAETYRELIRVNDMMAAAIVESMDVEIEEATKYNERRIVIRLNSKFVYDTAMEKVREKFSPDELEEFELKPTHERLYIYDLSIAEAKKPPKEPTAE